MWGLGVPRNIFRSPRTDRRLGSLRDKARCRGCSARAFSSFGHTRARPVFEILQRPDLFSDRRDRLRTVFSVFRPDGKADPRQRERGTTISAGTDGPSSSVPTFRHDPTKSTRTPRFVITINIARVRHLFDPGVRGSATMAFCCCRPFTSFPTPDDHCHSHVNCAARPRPPRCDRAPFFFGP